MFGAAKLTKNPDPDKYEYGGYSIGFDVRSHFSWSDGSWSENVVIFDADVSPSVYIDN